MSALADLAVRSSVLLLAGLALSLVLRRRSAALRHAVLAAAIFTAAAVVPLSLAGLRWQVQVPVWPRQPTVHVAAESVSAAARQAPRGTEPAAPPRGDLASRALLVWAIGAAAAAGMLLAGVARLSSIASRARRAGPAWDAMTQAVASSYGLKRHVVVLQTDAPDVLATWGAFRPRVLLPSHAREWSDDRARVVLCHELAHIRRHDWIVQIGAQALLTLLWFNPLMWLACTRLRRESEQACDDVVLERGVPAREYAGHLIDLARKCRRPNLPWASAVPMAHASTLERRITAMLNPRMNRTPLSHRGLAAIALLLFALAVPTAAFRAAQSAALSGSVYDPSGAVLPGVNLTLEDAQQAKFQATTDASGRFAFPRVAPGRYTLVVALAGFRELRHEFDLRNAGDWDRAITLQVGQVQETISVRERRVAASEPAAQSAPKPIRVGGNIRAPRKLKDVKPVYPATMRDAGREGVVPLEALIGPDGKVTSVRVLSAQVHPDFIVAAADAVRQWQFSPTLLNGHPVEVVMTVSVSFSLSD